MNAPAAGGGAVRLQRLEDLHDPGVDRRHRGGVLRLADGRHGLPDLDRGRAAGARHGLGREIAVAALVGSAFYGAVALAERAATFWHPSQRH